MQNSFGGEFANLLNSLKERAASLPNGHDPKEYHDELLKTSRAAKEKARGDLEKNSRTSRKLEDYEVEAHLALSMRDSLLLATWSEEFYRVRLLRHGRYHLGEQGEMIDDKTGLTVQELADVTKVKYFLESSVESSLKILEEVHVSEKILKSEKMKKFASRTLFYDDYYSDGCSLERAPALTEFVQIFGIEEELKIILSKRLDYFIKLSSWEASKNFVNAYSSFFDTGEVKKRFLEKNYPMKEGLKEKVAPDELFGDLVEGEGETAPLESIVEIIKQNSALLAEDIATNPYLYFQLKSCLLGETRAMGFGFGRWTIVRDYKKEKELSDKRNHCTVQFFLGEDRKEAWKKQVQMDDLRLEFHFSFDHEGILNQASNIHEGIFTTTKDMRFEGAGITNEKVGYRSPKDVPKNEFSIVFREGEQDTGVPKEFLVKKKALRDFSHLLLEPGPNFEEVLKQLESLKEKMGLDPEQLEEFVTAIQEFRKYTYREKKSEVGDCMTIPRKFKNFCQSKFGLPVLQARYGEYHPEWGSMGGYDPYTFMHIVNVVAGTIVVDWTVTQYGNRADKPIPYIYEIGDERNRFGTLYQESSAEKRNLRDPNEPFLDGCPEDKIVVYTPYEREVPDSDWDPYEDRDIV